METNHVPIKPYKRPKILKPKLPKAIKKPIVNYSQEAQLIHNDQNVLEISLPLFTVNSQGKKIHCAPSLNTLINESRWARKARKEHLEYIYEALGISAQFDPLKSKYGYKVETTRYCIKLLDPLDNLGGQNKNLVDLLVTKGILPDDSSEYIKEIVSPVQIKVSTKYEERLIFKITTLSTFVF